MPARLGRRLRPTAQQRLLLRCAFGDEETARASWAQLRPGLDVDRLDEGSHGLLPLVGRALARAGVEDPVLGRLKGIQRKAWFGNQLLLAGIGPSLNALRAAGIEPLLLHGTALMLATYPESGLRRTPVADVAVAPGSEARALPFLGRAGWVRHPEAPPSGQFPVPLVDPDGRLLILHAGLPEALQVPGAPSGALGEFWARATEVDAGQGTACVLEPTDQLLCTLAIGPDVTWAPDAQWLADAAMIIRRHAIAWPALAERARARRLTERVRAGLGTLEALGVDTGADDQLFRSATGRRERLEYRLYGARGRVLGGLPQTLAIHVRRTSGTGAGRALTSTPRFLAETWELAGPRQIPGAVLRKAVGSTGTRPAHVLQRSASSRGS